VINGALARACVLLAATVVAAACSRSTALEQLDERAGMTIVRAAEPLVFARTDPRYSRSARDYLYIAPIETNRQGVKEYYLWVGVASTIDRSFVAATAETPTVFYVTVGGEPMEFPLRPFAEVVRRTTVSPVYATAVPLQIELGARVTLQQLELLDAAGLDAIGVAADDTPLRTYTRWERAARFTDFLAVVHR
jgi:hypothetical protein